MRTSEHPLKVDEVAVVGTTIRSLRMYEFRLSLYLRIRGCLGQVVHLCFKHHKYADKHYLLFRRVPMMPPMSIPPKADTKGKIAAVTNQKPRKRTGTIRGGSAITLFISQ
jgi:hypothetical protein